MACPETHPIPRRAVLAGAAAFGAASALPKAARAAPKAEAWDRWARHDLNSAATVDHAAWDRFLKTYVQPGPDGVARVDYRAAKAGGLDALKAYVDRLAAVPVSGLSRAEQFAYWVNLYNALTLRVVLERYPVGSIRDIDISPGLFSDGPWGAKLVAVEGEGVSLDDIEHRILRPLWREPRVHYAVNCASIGCPDLARDAFTAANAEALLDAGARAFVNHPRGAQVQGGKLRVSSIYHWFKEDFGGTDQGVVRHLATYAAPDLSRALAGVEGISGHGYDWSLNDVSGAG